MNKLSHGQKTAQMVASNLSLPEVNGLEQEKRERTCVAAGFD